MKPKTVQIEGRIYKAFDTVQYRFIAIELFEKRHLERENVILQKQVEQRDAAMKLQDSIIVSTEKKYDLAVKMADVNEQKHQAALTLVEDIKAVNKKEVRHYKGKVYLWKGISVGVATLAAIIIFK